jgi:hypothetical protein
MQPWGLALIRSLSYSFTHDFMKMQLQFASVFYTFGMPSEGTEKKQRAESTKFRASPFDSEQQNSEQN